MITYLSIRNLAVIHHLNVNLATGMNILTGETGAGKSILIDALNLVLGARADTNLIRPGEDKCEVSAIFDITNNQSANQWLRQMELGNDECIIKRQLFSNGSSRAFINDSPVAQRALISLGEHLIAIYSQHAQHTLLNPNIQCQIVDRYGKLDTLLKETNDAHKTHQNLKKQWEKINQLDLNEELAELLQFQVEELEKFAPNPNEFAEISQKHHLLANAEDCVTDCEKSIETLSTDQDLPNILTHIQTAKNTLNKHQKHQLINDALSLLNDTETYINEATSYLQTFIEKFELDFEELPNISSRLSQWQELSHKHRIQPEALYETQKKLTERLDKSKRAREDQSQVAEQIEAQKLHWQQLADRLSQARTQFATKLESSVSRHLKSLHMEKAYLSIAITSIENSDTRINGKDDVSFLFTANADMPPRAMNKIASGGELSRVALAIAIATSNSATIPTLIFDEVDVGIGGATAESVGQMLEQISKKQQLLIITHQAQVAAKAQQHLRVSKNLSNDITSVQIKTLDAEQRITEIARMIGGKTLTDATRKHAMEMLNNNKTPESTL